VMEAFAFTWDDMVRISLDGVEGTWLDQSEKDALAVRVRREAAELAASLQPA
jgi:adenosine deaminase